ncbi:hypothetical protein C8A05DRAFT_34221 [Staphylotrichum tortipilum]|uniref:Uncharacterized protein n=1 Tax=Staphylotrichum tortipilum TaxID=2831512 RepID=A0AAN6MK58_9PEZI|nr:hypothetical protein C8A05DRAFT_34221 [Staphylotrichum longicolle]
MRDAAVSHANAHAVLLGIIAAYGVAQTFSVHLVHKHFDIPEGRIMVYEVVQGSATHPNFVLSTPRASEKCPNARGLYFKAAPGGNMVAYEFTTHPGADLSAHEDFVAAFAEAAVAMGVQDVFALTAISICPENTILTEFELAQALSTILVPDASWLPAGDVAESTTTDWIAGQEYAKYADGSVPGIIQLKCTKTRSNTHYNVTCSTTRSGRHLGHAPNPFPDVPMDSVLSINGEALEEGTEPHAIITRALTMVEVAH